MSYRQVMDRVSATLADCGRPLDAVTVVVVSKGRSVAEIESLYQLGHRDFGENRAQEITWKNAELDPAIRRELRWHFVGPLQTNKVRLVRPLVRVLHSLDRVDLARAWMKGPGSPPPALLQVNVGREPQKHGVLPESAEETLVEMEGLGVTVIGLMTIPAIGRNEAETIGQYEELASLARQLRGDRPNLTELSMGMSDDFELAIRTGATMIRVGRAIFGD